LIRRILSDDEAERMPPPDSNRHLTDQQKETLRRWVQQGAVWGQHWSFRRLSDPVPPQLRPDHQAQVINPIDNFVLRAIEDQGLDGLSPPARRERLIRRLTLDLTGLPPTLEEIAAFVNDPAPD